MSTLLEYIEQQDAQLIFNITHRQFIECARYIESGQITEQTILSEGLGKIKNFLIGLKDIFKKAGIKLLDIAKSSAVFKFAKICKFSIQKLFNMVKKGHKTAKIISKEVPKHLVTGGVTKADKLDDFLKSHPVLKRITGVGVAALLAYIWFNMAFTGDMTSDMNVEDIVLALAGKFSITDIFTGYEGFTLLSLFAAGKAGISFPWGGASTHQFLAALALTLISLAHRKLKSSQRKAVMATA